MIQNDEMLELFNEGTLKSAIYSALLMSLIDGELHENEWKIIETFAKKYWLDDYENFESYEKKIKKEIQSFLSDNEKLEKKISNVVSTLTPELTSHQKNAVLNLVGEVMIADGVMTLDESKLFAVFMEKMGIIIS